MSAAEFVAAVMEQLGVKDKTTEFSRILGLGENGPKRISRWLEGGTGPNYEVTMLMLEKAGWLNVGAEAGVGETGMPGSPLRALAEAVAELVAVNEEYDRRLKAVEERLTAAASKPAGAPRSSKRPATGRA